jgi:N-acetylmuramoyl-L-alanine amidase
MIQDRLLTINPYSRPGKALTAHLGVVLHWTEVPKQRPEETIKWWEDRKAGKTGFGSAHYVVGIDGDGWRAIPENEVAFHCGATRPTRPGGSQFYTDEARRRFPEWTVDYQHRSPNSILLGIELEPLNASGEFTPETWEAAVNLTAALMVRYGWTRDNLYTHHDIVGFKDCPRWMVDKPSEWLRFKCDCDKAATAARGRT